MSFSFANAPHACINTEMKKSFLAVKGTALVILRERRTCVG